MAKILKARNEALAHGAQQHTEDGQKRGDLPWLRFCMLLCFSICIATVISKLWDMAGRGAQDASLGSGVWGVGTI